MELEQRPKWNANGIAKGWQVMQKRAAGTEADTLLLCGNVMNTFDPDARIAHKLSFISLTFAMLASLLCWYGLVFYVIFIPFHSNLHPTSKSITNFWSTFLIFGFHLEFSLFLRRTWVRVYRCSFDAALVFLSFFYNSFSIPQLPPPFTCSFAFNLLCAIFTVNSITSNSLCFSLFLFFLLRLSFCCCRFLWISKCVHCTHGHTLTLKMVSGCSPFFLFRFPYGPLFTFFFFHSLYFIIFICYGTFNFNKWKLFSWIGQKEKKHAWKK